MYTIDALGAIFAIEPIVTVWYFWKYLKTSQKYLKITQNISRWLKNIWKMSHNISDDIFKIYRWPLPLGVRLFAGTILRQYYFCWQILPVVVARYAFCHHKHVSDLKVFCDTFSGQDMQRKLGLAYFQFTTSSQLFKAVNMWVLANSTTTKGSMPFQFYPERDI